MNVYIILDYDSGGGSTIKKVFLSQEKAIEECEKLKRNNNSPECIQLEIFETEN